jgi:hypothetical protein
VGFNKIDEISLDDGFVMRFNPYGQYIFPNRMAGIYGQLPISHLFNFAGSGEDFTGIGNLELGGVYLPWKNSDLILRAGMAVGTASEDDPGEVAANGLASYERLTDFVLAQPGYTTFRLSASTLQEAGMAFFRADGGFDFVLDKPAGADGQPSVIFRANAAGGIRTTDVDFALELVNLAAVNGDVMGGVTERFAHTLAIGARTRGVDQFHLGTVFPLDQDVRGELWIFSFGYLRAFN